MKYWRSIRFDFVLILITTFGCGFIFIGYAYLPSLISIGLSVVFVAVLFFMIIQKAIKLEDTAQLSQKILITEKKLAETQEKLNKRFEIERDESTNLLTKTVEFTTVILRSVSEDLCRISNDLQSLNKKDDDYCLKRESLRQAAVQLKSAIILNILKSLRMLFEGDTRALDTTTYPHNYFKVALFEVVCVNSKSFLRRTFYEYPPGIEPHSETEEVDINRYRRAAHVLAYRTEELVFLEDIQSEAKKTEHENKWMDLRHNHRSEYKSMVCVPIVKGKRKSKERKVLGVLCIDTDRERYFLEKPTYKAFLGSVLNPFRTIITLALELAAVQSKICN